MLASPGLPTDVLSHAGGQGPGPIGSSSVQQQQQREMAREEKILKRHLFGVPPPVDQATFDDAAAR